jgi:hypothetical protein
MIGSAVTCWKPCTGLARFAGPRSDSSKCHHSPLFQTVIPEACRGESGLAVGSFRFVSPKHPHLNDYMIPNARRWEFQVYFLKQRSDLPVMLMSIPGPEGLSSPVNCFGRGNIGPGWMPTGATDKVADTPI